MIRSYQSGTAAMVVSFLLMAVTAAMAKPCFTKEEARKQWPNVKAAFAHRTALLGSN